MIVNPVYIVMVRACCTDCCGVPESVAVTVKLEAPALVGVPVIAPVPEFSDKPAGSAPAVMLHFSGGVPPATSTEAL